MQNGDKTTMTRESKWWLLYIKGTPIEATGIEFKLGKNQL